MQYLKNAKIKLHQLDSIYNDFVDVATLRFNTGETNLLEKITAETKRNEVTILLKQVESEYSQAYNSLKTIININEDYEVNDAFEPMVLTTQLDSTAILQNPSLQLMYQQALIAEKNKSLKLHNHYRILK